MKSTHPTITVGLSVNAEINYTCQEQLGEKGKLIDFSIELGGSSANLAACLRNLNKTSNLLVPMTKYPSDENALLEIALKKSGLQRTPLMLLEASPLAIVPMSRNKEGNLLYGTKGIPTTNSTLIKKAKEEIESLDGQWRIATGVDKNVGIFADTLLGGDENKGYRIFSPHHSFCSERTHRKFLAEYFFRHSDMVILNEREFSNLNIPIDKLHAYGIVIVVVTAAEKGGYFSICNDTTLGKPKIGNFKATPICPNIPLFKVGAGDWFLGALSSRLVDYNSDLDISLMNVDFTALLLACNFAAEVAAKKITMKGPANGPTWRDIKEVEKILS